MSGIVIIMEGYVGKIGAGELAVVVGVEGSGRKTFATLCFPEIEFVERNVRLYSGIKKVVLVIMLDGSHLQNLAEFDVLKKVDAAIKRRKEKKVRLLMVLGRTDLVCSRQQNREWLERVMMEYHPYLKKVKVRKRKSIAHSNLAVQWLRRALTGEIGADDMDDLGYLLCRAGRRLHKFVSVVSTKTYLCSHLKSLQMLTGEYCAKEFLTRRAR